MDSIKRLREYVEDAPRTSISLMARSTLLGMARDIELELEQLREREYQNGREDAGGAVEFADRLCRASERREDVTLWGVDYVALPVDADGEYIHVGDVVVAQLLSGGESKPLVVDRMELSRGRDGDLWCVALDTDEGCWNQPSMLRHHSPTVEDVLEEFAQMYIACNDKGTIAEYAKRLRLVGEDE